jgi:excisionase family DNA binding protein
MVATSEGLSIKDAALLLRVSPSTIRRLIGSGELRAFRHGRQWRVPEESLDAYLLAKEGTTARDLIWERVFEIARRAPDVPEEEVERDVAEAVAWARHQARRG